MNKPPIKTHPYINGWSREAMTEAEENAYIAACKRNGQKVRFTKQTRRPK